MNADWRLFKLEDVVDDLTVGFVGPMTSEYRESGVPFLRSLNIDRFGINYHDIKYISEEFHQRIRKSALSPGDVVVVRTGKPGSAAVIPESLPVANCSDLVVIRPGLKIDNYFLMYYLNSISETHIRAQLVGAVQQHFNVGSARNLIVPLPDIETQKKIGGILRSLDDKINLNRHLNHLLEQTAQTLFRSWFIDFDPVRAKSRAAELGRDPERAAMAAIAGVLRVPKDTSGMSAEDFEAVDEGLKELGEEEQRSLLELATSLPEGMIESELGEIPETWTIREAQEIFEINPLRSLKKGSIAPYLDMKNMPTEGHSAVDVATREFTSGMKFINGDSLIARITPCLENGKTAFVDFLNEEQVGWGSTEYIVMRAKPPLPLEFSYYLARTERFRSYAIQNMAGTSGRQRVGATAIETFKLCMPNESLLVTKFGELVRPLMEGIRKNNLQSWRLAEVRDQLLPKLISGEISIQSKHAFVENELQ